MKAACKRCRFYESAREFDRRFPISGGSGADYNDPNGGSCHRYPPSQPCSDKPGPQESMEFPHVHEDEWCGEFKARPAKPKAKKA